MMRGAVEARRRPNQLPARANAAGRGLSFSREIRFTPEMSPRVPIARGSAAPFKKQPSRLEEAPHGHHRLSDHACRERADPDRALGDLLVSARIIRFVPRTSFDHRLHEAPQPFRSMRRPDDLAMDHADTAPCEYSPPLWQQNEDEPA